MDAHDAGKGIAVGNLAHDDAVMEEIRSFVTDAVGWALGSAVQVTGFLLAAALVLAWCLFVFMLTGRLPWFVRKYF